MEAPVENDASHKKNPTKKKGKLANRFSDGQIKLLESIFKEDSKLEPSRKLQIARDLGLQPRQVAIWFQNRRARWKSKQIEQDYKVLKASYDDLYAQSESLIREKQSLQIQLQELKNRLKNNHDENSECKAIPGCLDSLVVDPNGLMHEDDEEEKISHYFGNGEEGEIMSLGRGDSSPLTSSENWCNLCSEGIFDHSCETSNWWETV